MKNKWIIFGASVFSIALIVEVVFSFYRFQSKPLCYEESCNNLDATYQRCHLDAKTLIEEELQGRKIELRHSARCNASWTRAIVPPGSTIYVKDSQGNIYADNYTVPNDKVPAAHYGNMGPGKKLRACVGLPNDTHLCTKLANEEK
ncbi:MAG: DUF2690 domain-containing protein [Cyanobacteria bacterium P01_D01_bin.50]